MNTKCASFNNEYFTLYIVTDSNRTAHDGVWANQDEGKNVREFWMNIKEWCCETWWAEVSEAEANAEWEPWAAEISCTIDFVNQEYLFWEGLLAVDLDFDGTFCSMCRCREWPARTTGFHYVEINCLACLKWCPMHKLQINQYIAKKILHLCTAQGSMFFYSSHTQLYII